MILSYEHKLRAHQEITGAECSSDKVRFSDTDIEQNALYSYLYRSSHVEAIVEGYSKEKRKALNINSVHFMKCYSKVEQ